jgi:hypothetical protein
LIIAVNNEDAWLPLNLTRFQQMGKWRIFAIASGELIAPIRNAASETNPYLMDETHRKASFA